MRAAPSQVLAPAGRTLRLLHDSVPGLVDGTTVQRTTDSTWPPGRPPRCWLGSCPLR
jgi:hypothetical protein